MAILRTIFDTLGLESERVHLEWISASEGKKFADTVKKITDETRQQGPNPLAKQWSI